MKKTFFLAVVLLTGLLLTGTMAFAKGKPVPPSDGDGSHPPIVQPFV